MPFKKVNKAGGLEGFGFVPATPEPKLESFAPEEHVERPTISSYINPYHRLDQELKKRGFSMINSPNRLGSIQGRGAGSYPHMPKGRFSDYDGTVYIRKPAPNYIWVQAAWIPLKPMKEGVWCAYWSPTPTDVVSRCGATEDIAVNILLELIDHVAKPGPPLPGQKRPTLEVNLPSKPMDLRLPGRPPVLPEASGVQILLTEEGRDIENGTDIFAHVRMEIEILDETIQGEELARITVDLFKHSDKNWHEGHIFNYDDGGLENANEYLRENGFTQTLVLRSPPTTHTIKISEESRRTMINASLAGQAAARKEEECEKCGTLLKRSDKPRTKGLLYCPKCLTTTATTVPLPGSEKKFAPGLVTDIQRFLAEINEFKRKVETSLSGVDTFRLRDQFNKIKADYDAELHPRLKDLWFRRKGEPPHVTFYVNRLILDYTASINYNLRGDLPQAQRDLVKLSELLQDLMSGAFYLF